MFFSCFYCYQSGNCSVELLVFSVSLQSPESPEPLFFKDFIYSQETQRETETQAEGEAGAMQGA